MTTVFLSYSTNDYFFAELAIIKLGQSGIQLWRDQDKLRAGSDWRQGIEHLIADSLATLVALSPSSVESSYVTYEWAYALGAGKPIIPILLAPCSIHPRLAVIQYVSFINRESLPWDPLVERIREIEEESESSPADDIAAVVARTSDPDDAHVKAILAYLDQRGYRMVSFERFRRLIDPSLTDDRFREIIRKNPTVLRQARLSGGVPGVAKLIS